MVLFVLFLKNSNLSENGDCICDRGDNVRNHHNREMEMFSYTWLLGGKNHPSFIIISSLLPLVFLEGNKTRDDMDRN